MLFDLSELEIFFGGTVPSHFVKLTIYPLLMGLDSSAINMKGVDFSLHLRFRYFFSKEKKVNLHYFNKISFVTRTLIHNSLTCKNLLSCLYHLLASPLASFRQHIKSLERLGHMIKLAAWF